MAYFTATQINSYSFLQYFIQANHQKSGENGRKHNESPHMSALLLAAHNGSCASALHRLHSMGWYAR
jgi:hypothetical protein